MLDPFAGLGATVLAAMMAGKRGIGIELCPDFASHARQRLEALDTQRKATVICGDARELLRFVGPDSVDLVITSPPYWDVLTRRRSADRKQVRHYGHQPADLGRIADYGGFLDALEEVFGQVARALRPGKKAAVVVMDVRKGGRFYPFHSDLAARLERVGLLLEDIIIWDRRQEYNNFRPLGYPWVFRVNKAHEYILLFHNSGQGAERR